MLQNLKIQNVALIPQVEIEFGSKFNVISGETGAGKSIVIGSFDFILGEKLKPTVIRQGASFAKVDAVFLVAGADLVKITERTGIVFPDNELIITRVLKDSGKSECRINGEIVTLQILREVSNFLIQIHGQHEHETLLKPSQHINILDEFGGVSLKDVKEDYVREFMRLQDLKKQLAVFGGSDAERDRLVDIYEYQIAEIERAALKDGEDEELAEYKQRMLSFEKIYNSLNSALEFLSGESGVRDNLKRVLGELNMVSSLDTKIEKMADATRSLEYELDDVYDSIESYLSEVEYNEQKLREADARLDEIKILKRKYGATIPAIFTFLIETRQNLENLRRSAEQALETKAKIDVQAEKVHARAEALTHIRKDIARKLEEEIVSHLKDLGMPTARFRVDFDTAQLSGNGIDMVEFLFSANTGVDLRPLAEIISGGEMSRFMLALKTVIARIDNVSTLVFDEVDTGIGGKMGTEVAKKMQSLSRFTQIIVVSHLAQIASMADTHFLIEKSEGDNKTSTSIKLLDDDERIVELARMIGGESVSAAQHAKTLKKFSDEFKSAN